MENNKKINIIELAEKFEKGEISMNDESYKKASDALAKMANAEQYTEIAQLVTQYIEDTYNEFDVIPVIFETKNFRLGDEPLFKTHKKGIVAYETAPNAYVPKSENYEVEYTMKFTNLGVRPTCLLQDLKTGRVDSLAALIRDAKEARQTKRIAMVWELLAQTYNATQNKENYFKGNNLTKEIVVSSRVRLARNFDKYNFPIRLSNDADAKQIQREVFSVVNFGNNFMFCHILSYCELVSNILFTFIGVR